MRLEEICQLRVRDIKQDTDLGLYFSINDEAGKSVKTRTSRRNVPVHRVLTRIGFIDFLKYASDQQHDWLFPDLKKDKYARRSSEFSKKWNRQLRNWLAMEPADRSRSFHSFRHSFKDVARLNELGEEISDRLTGHRAAASEGRRYGGATYPMRPLVRAMERYRVEGLSLAHVKWKSYGARRANH
jgi:integrase